MAMTLAGTSSLVYSHLIKVIPLFSSHRAAEASPSDREITRKQYVLSLENRTPEQLAEEEALYMEIKRLEQGERQFKKDRDELLRTLSGVESGLADIHVDDDSALSGLTTAEPKKRKKGGHYIETDSPMVATPSAGSGIAPIPPKKPQSAKSIAYGCFCYQTSPWNFTDL
jgi:DNA methyltransferase 1-associated protein 1